MRHTRVQLLEQFKNNNHNNNWSTSVSSEKVACWLPGQSQLVLLAQLTLIYYPLIKELLNHVKHTVQQITYSFTMILFTFQMCPNFTMLEIHCFNNESLIEAFMAGKPSAHIQRTPYNLILSKLRKISITRFYVCVAHVGCI